MSLTVTEVMLEVVPLVLQSIEGLVLDFPACLHGLHQLDNFVFVDLDVG